MSLTTTVQDWMRAIGSRERSAVTTRRHVAAETSTDVDTICATISHDVFFGVPVRTRAGNEIPDGSVLTTYDQVRGYYEGRAGSYVVLASAQLKSLTTDTPSTGRSVLHRAVSPPSAMIRMTPTMSRGMPTQRNGKNRIPMMDKAAPRMSSNAPVVSSASRLSLPSGSQIRA